MAIHFGSRRTSRTYGNNRAHERRSGGMFHHKDPERQVAGYRAALSNPNTTHAGRQRAEAELHARGQSAHVPLSTKIKRTLGIRSSPRKHTTRY